LIFDTFHNRIYLKLLCAFSALTIFSSAISSPVNVIGQTDDELAQAVEICDNGFDDNGNGLVDSMDGLCSVSVGQVQPAKSQPEPILEEQSPDEICDNGVDDNGDGVVDGQHERCGPQGHQGKEQPQGNNGQSCTDNVTDCMSKGELPTKKSENPQCPNNGNATDCITTGELPSENLQCPNNGNATDCQTTNLAPIASAGNMQQVSTNQSVNLNGLGSYDPDGNLTSFQWVQMGGEPSVKLQDSDTIQPTFIAPMVSNKSLLTFELKVTDNMGLTDTDSTVVSVSNTTSSSGRSTINGNNNGYQDRTGSSQDNQFTTKSEKSKTDTSIKNKADTQVKKSTRADMTESISTTFQPYRYNKLGISLEHPPDWKFASLKNGIQLINEKNGVYVEIRKHNLESSNPNLKQYVFDDIKERSTERQDFKILNITATTISGNLPAYKTEYSFLKTEDQKDFTINGTTNKILRFWTFANGNAYTVAYVSERGDYDLYFPVALKIIDTLKINPGSQQSFSDNDSKNNDKSNDSKNNDKSNDSKDGDDGGDKDCSDFDKKNFKVQPGDPYDLDRDNDGIACEG
jgi:Excalibur calcium-binding domain